MVPRAERGTSIARSLADRSMGARGWMTGWPWPGDTTPTYSPQPPRRFFTVWRACRSDARPHTRPGPASYGRTDLLAFVKVQRGAAHTTELQKTSGYLAFEPVKTCHALSKT